MMCVVRRISFETGRAVSYRRGMTKPNPFKGFHSSPEIIRLAVMLYVRFPLSLRNVEDLLHERGVDIGHETVRYWLHPLARCSLRRSESAGSKG